MLRCLLHAPRVPFIAPRQLGAVESKSGRPSLPSVVGRTGQSGAHRTVSGARFLSLNGEADRCRCGSRWRTGHVRCTPDSPVPPSSRWLGHVSRADSAADRWLGRPLAHRTVRCTTGQSGAPPDSPVIYSRTSPTKPESSQFAKASLAHRTLSGAPPDSPVHHRTVRCTQTALTLAELSHLFSNSIYSVSST